MPVVPRRRRRLAIVALALIGLIALAIPGAGAQAAATPDWYGWGVNVDFLNGQPKVMYISYAGKSLPQVQVLAARTTDISGSCHVHGNLQIVGDTATFDGLTAYIDCDLPAWSAEIKAMGYNPSWGGSTSSSCPAGRGPFWVDSNVVLSGTAGTYPLFDASDVGIRANLLSNGSSARSELKVAAQLAAPPTWTTYTSPAWMIDKTGGNRAVMGWYGKGIVGVADTFGWLNYLTDPNWRVFYNNLGNPTLGYWHESALGPSARTTMPAGPYELGTAGGKLYIGFSPSTGTYLRGTLDGAGIEPGCSGA